MHRNFKKSLYLTNIFYIFAYFIIWLYTMLRPTMCLLIPLIKMSPVPIAMFPSSDHEPWLPKNKNFFKKRAIIPIHSPIKKRKPCASSFLFCWKNLQLDYRHWMGYNPPVLARQTEKRRLARCSSFLVTTAATPAATPFGSC